jgi:hypothetical protein
MRLTDEQLDGNMQTAAEIKPDTEGLFKQMQCQIGQFLKRLILLKKTVE